MKVKQLKVLLERVPDDALVVVEVTDHEYREAGADLTTALDDQGCLTEDSGEDITAEADYGKRISVLLVQ